jgi:outer membrane lipoprotein SlyB
MKNNKVPGFIAAAAAILLAGCTAGTEQGSVRIVSIKPAADAVIRVDDRLDVEVAVEYTLKSEKGGISLVIQNEDATGADRHIASERLDLSAGSGTVTLKKSIIVPQTTKIGVFTPVYTGGVYKKTSIVDHRRYKVEPKK